jgi:hypothetical protein
MTFYMRGNLIWVWRGFIYTKEAINSVKYNPTSTSVY